MTLTNKGKVWENFLKLDLQCNTHRHALHHTWCLDVFEDNQSLETIHHKCTLCQHLDGVFFLEELSDNCQEVILDSQQHSPAVSWFHLIILN